eukprot:7991265-Pyramimonas_sp.AAC.1
MGPAVPNDWRGPTDREMLGDVYCFQWTYPAGDLESVDEARGLLEDFQDTAELQQRAPAESHFCGSGIAGGVDNLSLRTLVRQHAAA